MNTNSIKKLEAVWLNKLGGTRFTALLFGLIGITYMVVIFSLVMWAVTKTPEFGFAIVIASETLAGTVAYITGKTYQHKKEIENGTKK